MSERDRDPSVSDATAPSDAGVVAGKAPAASRVEMTEIVLPGDTNALGTIFGGKVMQWIDIAASVAGMRHSGGNVVTASIDGLTFLTPIHLGEVVLLKAQVNFAGRTSMEIGVRVEAENPRTRRASLHDQGVPDLRGDRCRRQAARGAAADARERRRPPARGRRGGAAKCPASAARCAAGIARRPTLNYVAGTPLVRAFAPARLVLTGDDRVRFLHGMVTNDIEVLKAGQGCHAAMLTAKGKMLADLVVLADETSLTLVLDATLRDKIKAVLDKHIIMDDVEVADRPDEPAVGVYGDDAAAAVARATGLDAGALAALPNYHFVDAGRGAGRAHAGARRRRLPRLRRRARRRASRSATPSSTSAG